MRSSFLRWCLLQQSSKVQYNEEYTVHFIKTDIVATMSACTSCGCYPRVLLAPLPPQRLGEGGFAVVDKCLLLAEQDNIQEVAVKRLRRDFVAEAEDLSEFLEEANVMRKL